MKHGPRQYLAGCNGKGGGGGGDSLPLVAALCALADCKLLGWLVDWLVDWLVGGVGWLTLALATLAAVVESCCDAFLAPNLFGEDFSLCS